MFGHELDFQEDFLRTRVLVRVASLVRAKFVTIITTVGTAFLPTLLFHFVIVFAFNHGVVIGPVLQEFLGFTSGFLGALLGHYAIQHQLSRFPVSSPETLVHSFRAGFGSLPRFLELGFRTVFGVVVGLLLLVVPGIQRWCRWYVALPVLVVEKCGAKQAMQRSSELTRGHLWNILALLVVGGVLSWLIDSAEGAILNRIPEAHYNPAFLVFWFKSVLEISIFAVLQYATYLELLSASESNFKSGPAPGPE
jgi:hypothetical protein